MAFYHFAQLINDLDLDSNIWYFPWDIKITSYLDSLYPKTIKKK